MIAAFFVVVFFSILGFWKANPLPFMLAAGSSIILGCYWYDIYTNHLGLTMGLMLMVYGLICVGYAFRCIFWGNKVGEE